MEQLTDRGILLGIKVDIGVVPLPGSPDETITQVSTGLPQRIAAKTICSMCYQLFCCASDGKILVC